MSGVEPVGELRLFSPMTALIPTPSMLGDVEYPEHAQEPFVFQCSWCGCLVALTESGKPNDCPQCDRRPTSWWRQDLSVGPFHQCPEPNLHGVSVERINVALELLAEYEAEYGEYYEEPFRPPTVDVRPDPSYL